MKRQASEEGLYSGGHLLRYAAFASENIKPRPVDIWLPPGYDDGDDARYPVIYMHDGQNLFEPGLAYVGVDWGIDEAIVRLMHAGKTGGAIVVAPWNTERRRAEYMPQKPLSTPAMREQARRFAAENGALPFSDFYLRFLVEELKPFVDATYRTRPGREATFIMGSSMGGLISLYGLCEHPQIFGAAACVSTHWPIGEEPLVDWFAAALPAPGTHRIYFDYGTETLDAQYEPYQARMDGHMEAVGYRRGVDWETLKFEGAEHSEVSWRERADIPLAFLLGNLGPSHH